MLKVGVHVSIAGSIDKAVDRAAEKGCDTFQIFSRNPRSWRFKELSEETVQKFRKKLKKYGIFPPVDHMPYLPNLASPKDEVHRKSVKSLTIELERCDALGIPYLVTHLGSHLGSGKEAGLKRIVKAVRKSFSDADNSVMLLLETTSDSKNSVGGSFEDLGMIMGEVNREDRIGVCLDTCHVFAAGYELRTEEGLAETMEKFSSIIELGQLKVVHLNDSKGGLGSKLDRHEHIGLGEIGEEGFRAILHHPEIRTKPLILETPVDERRDDQENMSVVNYLAVTSSRH
ncbi:MAG: deoxyribonuclease IV [Methanotrichaceae archaeon]